MIESDQGAPTGYFCISAVSTYHGEDEYSDLKDLVLVPREVETMREAFAGLGLTELFPPDGDELTHEQLRQKLDRWADEYDPDDPAATKSTLVIYCTGHGLVDGDDREWRLIPPLPRGGDEIHWTTPRSVIRRLHRRKDLEQIILILDACFAADGAREALAKSLALAPELGSTTDLWFIAAARRSEKAQQLVFAPAFAEALRRGAADNLSKPYLDPSLVTDTAAAVLSRRGGTQVPWVAAGYRAGGCRALPNPSFMPVSPPDWIEQRWSAPARGVSTASELGWFFTGRDQVLRDLDGYLSGESGPAARPVLLTGTAGTGKTAVLARLLTTATASLRRRLPPVARRGYLPTGDAEITALDATGADADFLAGELARRLHLPATSVTGVLAALTTGERSFRIVIDQVDQADDPVALVSALIQPLSAIAAVRLVVAAQPGPVVLLPGFRPVDLQGPGDDAQTAVEAYVRERLTYYLGSADDKKTKELIRAVTALSSSCAANFSAATAAVDALVRRLRAGQSMKQACDEAQRSACRRLDQLCRSVLAHARGEPSSRYVDDLLACLSAACSYSPNGWLPGARWAGVARWVNGLPYTTQDVEACAGQALAFLATELTPDGVRVWRPRYGYLPSGSDLLPQHVIEHLQAEIGHPGGHSWNEEQPGVLAILLGAAVTDDLFAGLLDDAELLLAAPAPVVRRAMNTIRDRAGGPARTATWNGVPAEGDTRHRGFLLRLRARRSGLDRLASSPPPRDLPPSPRVIWATHLSHAERRSLATGLALAAGPAGLRLVTSQADGSVTWWDGSDGRELRTWTGLRAEGAAAASIAAAQTPSGLVTAVAAGDGRVLCWGQDDTEPRLLPWPASHVAVHVSGLAALVYGRSVSIVDLTAGAPGRSFHLLSEVSAADVGGTAAAPVLWLTDSRGRVWRCDLLDSRSRQPSPVAQSHPVSLLGCSREGGSAVVVDGSGALTWPARPRAVARRQAAYRSVALTEDWLVLGAGTGRFSGWLDLYGDDGPAGDRWPLDGLPVGLGLAGDVLVAATPDGLAGLHLPRGGQPHFDSISNTGAHQ